MQALRPTAILLVLITASLPLAGQENPPPKSDDTVVVKGSGGERADAQQPDLDAVARLIVEQTNDLRKEQQRDPLEVNVQLTKAARAFAAYMAKTNRYGHNADGHSPVERVAAAEYDYCTVRENIAYAFRSGGFNSEALAERFTTGWKKSPGHRQNMLARYVVETGVAIAKSNDTDTYFAVQLFGRPKSKAIEFTIKNTSALTVPYRLGERPFQLTTQTARSHQECQPSTIEFLPVASDADVADPVTPVRRVEVTGGETLTIQPADDGYTVKVSKGNADP